MASTGIRGGRFLPPDPHVDEPYLFTPKLALRVAVLGVIALAVFAVLVLRLWALQVLAGTRYQSIARNNQVRFVRFEAPRGAILDRDGRTLVTNVASTAVELWPADLPKQGRYRELRALAAVVNAPLHQLVAKVEARKGDPLTPVIVQVAVHEDQVAYIKEHWEQFRGVHIVPVYLRHYNAQALAAQVLGYVREITPVEVKQVAKSGYPAKKKPVAGETVGQAGVEATYDRYLRGTSTVAPVHVDALGRLLTPIPFPPDEPQPGYSVRLTIDIQLQRAAERALQYGIRLALADGKWAADGGAIVALDPNTGEILALASAPTYKPGLFVGRVNPKKLAPMLEPSAAKRANYPTLDRATAGLFPPGSSFKPVTALAAMQEHIISPYQTLPCTGKFAVHKHVFYNWDPYVDQPMTLPTALAASCDTYFYRVGYQFYGLPPDRGHPLQAWASRFGFGQLTGVDVGPEERGLLPTPEWRQATYTKATDPCCWQVDRLWKPGDSIQLAIGQKDLLVTPLQMARFYALVANGGKLVAPHVVMDVEQPGSTGSPPTVTRTFASPAPQPSGVDPSALAVVRYGLYQATHASYGTSAAVFGNFPIPIAGKTGTAEKVVQPPGTDHPLLEDQSWWCGYGPADKPSIVVCALIENGGHGGTAAAPAALQVFEQYFHKKAPPPGAIYSD